MLKYEVCTGFADNVFQLAASIFKRSELSDPSLTSNHPKVIALRIVARSLSNF